MRYQYQYVSKHFRSDKLDKNRESHTPHRFFLTLHYSLFFAQNECRTKYSTRRWYVKQRTIYYKRLIIYVIYLDFQLTTTPPRLGENSVPRINDVNDALEGSISYQEEEQRQQDHQQQQAQDNGGTETMCDVCKDFCCDVYVFKIRK